MYECFGCMNVMLYGMPIFSIWFAFNVPAGVGFYWACSSLVSLLIQIGLNKYFTPERINKMCEKDNAKNRAKYANGKKSFSQRMMEAQNQAAGMNGTPSRDADTEKMSKREKSEYESQRIKDARKRLAEKYGDDYSDEE